MLKWGKENGMEIGEMEIKRKMNKISKELAQANGYNVLRALIS